MDQRQEDHMKMNFEYFQIQKWILQTVRVEKVDEKNSFHIFFVIYGPNIV